MSITAYLGLDLGKSEIRISKSETNPNYRNPNDQNIEYLKRMVIFGKLENLNFEFVSCFVLRISDFLLLSEKRRIYRRVAVN